jgi:uncharacterized protein YoxC
MPADSLREASSMPNLDSQTLLLLFVAITGLAVLLQAIILFAIYISVRHAARVIREDTESLRSAVMPIIYNTRDLLTNSRDLLAQVTPKVEAAVDDLAAAASGLRLKTYEIQVAADKIVERVQRQSDRIDGMFSNALDSVDRAGVFVAEVVAKPVRQVAALLASVKAVVGSLRTPVRSVRSTNNARPESDQESFL